MNEAVQKYVVAAVVMGLLVIGVLFLRRGWLTSTPAHVAARCPEAYASDAERREGIAAFVAEQKAANPGATTADLSKARRQWLEDNNCQETLDSLRNSPAS